MLVCGRNAASTMVFLAPKLLKQKIRPGNIFPYGAVSGLKHGLALESLVLHRLQKCRFSGSLLFFLLKANPREKEVKES